MSKKVIAIVLLICLILLILPVRSYAAAAGAGILIGGTVYAAGTYSFGTLPPVVQGIMNSAAEDYQNQLFPSKSNIILLDPNFSSGGGNNNNNKKPVEPGEFEKFVMFIISSSIYIIEKASDEVYNFAYSCAEDIAEAYNEANPPSEAEVALAKDIVQKGVDRVNETEFGNKPLTVEEFTDKSGYDYKNFLNEHGLVDNGKSIFSDLKSVCPYISDIQVFDFNTFDYKYDLTGCQSPSRDDPVPTIYFYYVDGQHLKEVAAWQLYNSNEWFRYWIDDQGRLLRSTSSNSSVTIKHSFQSPYPENIIVIKYLPVAPSDTNVFRTPVAEYVITDEDFITTPGVNPTYVSDVEKAALGLASHLGVDVGVIGTQFNVVFDENGNKYMEQIATGTRYSVDEFMNVFNEINAGNTAIINSLQNLLDQLKSQDISGIESIVSQIQSNIDDLNNRDKNREAVYSNITETLTQVKAQLEKNYIDPEIINDINSNIEAISSVISPLSDPIQIDEDKLKAPATITTKFPFSLPFDIYHIFNVFSADPVTPEFDVPIDMTTVGGDVYNVHIDLSQFDFIAEIVRWLLYAVFIAGLIILTNRLIGRG